MALQLTWAIHDTKSTPCPNFFERDWQEKARLEREAMAAPLEDKFEAFFGPRAVDEEPVEPPEA